MILRGIRGARLSSIIGEPGKRLFESLTPRFRRKHHRANPSLTVDELRYLVDNIFLHPQLPHEEPQNCRHKDYLLLQFITTSATAFNSLIRTPSNANEDTAKGWERITRMLHTMSSLHSSTHLSKKPIEAALSSMKLQDAIPLHIANQNAGVIFRKTSASQLTFESFEVSLPNETIMGTVGKVCVQYPASPRIPVAINADTIATMANILAFFDSTTETRDALPTTYKGGTGHAEIRDPSSPRYITEAFAGFLRGVAPADSKPPTTYIQKRIGDHILWKSTLKPWRRSPIWLVVRVALQSTMLEAGLDEGYGYKAFQVFVMARLLAQVLSTSGCVSDDIIHLMNKKIARRLWKIRDVVDSEAYPTLKFVVEKVAEVSSILNRRWESIQQTSIPRNSWTAPSTRDIDSSIQLSLPSSSGYLRKVIARTHVLDSSYSHYSDSRKAEELVSGCTTRLVQSPESLPSTIDTSDTSMGLYDFESWVEHCLPKWTRSSSRSSSDCQPLVSIIDQYYEIANKHYKEQPELISIMFLCIIELWVALDTIVTSWCPLLKDYTPDIPADLFDPLLLSDQNELRRLHDVQSYLRQRHQFALDQTGLSIFGDVNHPQSFSNMFFDTSSHLKSIKAQIQDWTDSNVEAKLKEMDQKNSEYHDLMAQAEPMKHEQIYKKTKRKGWLYIHDGLQCQRCKLRCQARSLHITPFEKPLPEAAIRANPIVFELDCPRPFSIWRDCSYRILMLTQPPSVERTGDQYTLTSYSPLSQFFVGRKGDLGLASSTKSLSQSHYGKSRELPATSSEVVCQHAGQFGLINLSKNGSLHKVGGNEHLRSLCTLRVDKPYESMQQYLYTTDHPPNSVIAAQLSEKALFLSPNKYVAFGQLRSGNRIQIRNILRALVSNSLSFAEPSIFSLIIQTLWQAGPEGDHAVVREAHVDLTDDRFGEELLRELYGRMNTLGDNWKESLALATFIALATRLHSLTNHAHVATAALSFLSDARSLALMWLDAALKEESSSANGPATTQYKSAQIGAIYRSTFHLNSKTVRTLLKSTENVANYVFASTPIANYATKLDEMPFGLRLLFRRDKRLSFKIETRIIAAIKKSPSILDLVAKKSWNGFHPGTSWSPLQSPGERWWKCITSEEGNRRPRHVYINTVDGTILVDGSTLGHLPSSYVNHPTYQELFKSSALPFSRPSSMLGMEYEIFYGNLEVHFLMTGSELIVRVRHGAEIEEYIPNSTLKGDIPLELLENCALWYRGHEGSIDIRPEHEKWQQESTKRWSLRLFESGSSLYGHFQRTIPNGIQFAVDPHSNVLQSLARRLNSLEPEPLRLTVLLVKESSDSRLVVVLPRQTLEFFLNKADKLECRSIPGHILDDNHDIGTLYGLQKFVVLQDNSILRGTRKVILPRGKVSVTDRKNGHPIVHIDSSGVSGIFVYEVDNLVGRLISNRTIESEMFLALLHAYTSSHLPDPLTRRTGSEEALERLSGALNFSFQERPSNWKEQLEQIASLTPQREYYPKHLKAMEKITWHRHLPITSQQIGFSQVVERITSFWKELESIYQNGNDASQVKITIGSSNLHTRADLRLLTHGIDNFALKQSSPDHDTIYQHQNSLSSADSRTRESRSYLGAASVMRSDLGLPVCHDLEVVAAAWGSVNKSQDWNWDNTQCWFSPEIPFIWSTFYHLCRTSQNKPHPSTSIAAAFSLLAYRNIVPLNILGTLIAVLKTPNLRDALYKSCQTHDLNMRDGSVFESARLQSLLLTQEIGFSSSAESIYEIPEGSTQEEQSELRHRAEQLYKSCLDSEVAQILTKWESLWPNIPATMPHMRLLSVSSTFFAASILPIFKSWQRNLQFLRHLRLVAQACLKARPNFSQPPSYIYHQPTLHKSPHSSPKFTLEHLLNVRALSGTQNRENMKHPAGPYKRQTLQPRERSTHLSHLCDQFSSRSIGQMEMQYGSQLRISLDAYCEQPSAATVKISSIPKLTTSFDNANSRLSCSLNRILASLGPKSIAENILDTTGLWPRISPKILLRRLSLHERGETPKKWIKNLCRLAEEIVLVQQQRRLLRFATFHQNLDYTAEILRSRNRSSYIDVDWLLFEIDSDRSIRSNQVEIAQAMVSPQTGENSVMQLNMGEGKSSVIVPIAALTLADGNQLVRVIVLKAQAKQQLHFLRQQISDLANRRILFLPFNRSFPTTTATTQSIANILESCRKEGGVWLCQPEQLLSFKLLGLDRIVRGSGDEKIGYQLIKTQLWTDTHVRDILDESDEILHTKNQLIYTVGEQKNMDNAPSRWEIIQDLLHLLSCSPAIANKDHFLVGPRLSTAQFPCIRIVSEAGKVAIRTICHQIIWEEKLRTLSFRNFPAAFKQAAFQFITEIDTPKETASFVHDYCEANQVQSMWQNLLLLRGLVAFDLLLFALKDKRWRVDYGLDICRSQLAVPYRAKDTPSPRSEFAHPDVALLLTCLSYYYQGLSDQMLLQTVKRLMQEDGAELIYEVWIKSCWDEVPSALRAISGINTGNDKEILRSLGPFLRHNVKAINFFMNNMVFPKEAKEFAFKLSTSGWDIAKKKRHLTTGFSGTNDTRFLLPTLINQLDSPSQLHTNAKVLDLLLRPENGTVVQHPNNLTTSEFLDYTMRLKPPVNVFLDVGAQILDSSNKEFSKAWLSRYDEGSNVKAVIFVDEDDNICVMTRDGTVQPMIDSPYANRLSECIVYLDDVHTRGIDLKLPPSRAVVTLGPKLTKDKLVQGCMRMRKLGTEHSVVFFAPQEVVYTICNTAGCAQSDLATSDVLLWTMLETCRQLQANVASWALQGHSFAMREEKWKQLSSTGLSVTNETAESFYEVEARSLEHLYNVGGLETTVDWAKRLHSEQATNKISRAVFDRSKLLGNFSFTDFGTLEEKEIELVHEKEVEREVQKPLTATPVTHHLHSDVQKFVETGTIPIDSSGILSLANAFKHVSLRLPKGFIATFANLFVTSDFSQTVQVHQRLAKGDMNSYLRPVEWVAALRQGKSLTFVLLSPFEVNELLPLFRSSKKVTLHLFCPRSSLSMRSLENLDRFTLPTLPPTTHFIAYPGTALQQLDLFAGSLYLRDKKTYEIICSMLRLYFGIPPAHIVEAGTINPDGFVTTTKDRQKLGLTCKGFEENPTHFFRQLISFRRHGRDFLPSHIGHILHGIGLDEKDFV